MNLRQIFPSGDGVYRSPNDFTAAYTSATTITLSGLTGFTILDSSQILSILQIKADDTSVLYQSGINGITITHSGGVLTIHGVTDPFVTGDVYRIAIDGQQKDHDSSTGSQLVSVINPVYAHYTDPQHIDEDNEGAQNDTKYTRHAFDCYTYTVATFTYLLTADDTHNDVTLKVYGTLKHDYSLPDEDTAIANTDEIFNMSLDVLGDADGVTINNGTIGDIVHIDYPSKCVALIFELKYDEDNTAAPANAADLRVMLY